MPLAAKITVCITAHYVPARIPLLNVTLKSMLEWDVERVEIWVISNDTAITIEPELRAIENEFILKNWPIHYKIEASTRHPFLLTWVHREICLEWTSSSSPDEYFIYIEDDIVLTARNIQYFIKHLPSLRAYRLIPSFIAYETVDSVKVAKDFENRQFMPTTKRIMAGDRLFICPKNQYWAGYIMDKALALEFIRSDSFDLEKSTFVSPWDLRARAAMGIAFESPPRGFIGRHVVPLDDGRFGDDCLVWHCAQNYHLDSKNKFATIPIDRVMVGFDVVWIAQRVFDKCLRMIRGDSRKIDQIDAEIHANAKAEHKNRR